MKSDDIPCILLVEDDPVAHAFLAASIEAAGFRVDGAGSVAQALDRAAEREHAAWLIDANLPDGRGDALLVQLRQQHPARPAIAHTASHLPEELDALLQAGFQEVLVKPLPSRAVADALQRALTQLASGTPGAADDGNAPGALPVWNDEDAARTMGGNMQHVAALRDLFLAELPQVRERIAEAGRLARAATVLDEVHKLRASCGFVGAARLASAAAALRADACGADALAQFDRVAEDTLSMPPLHRQCIDAC
ncbi:response regulator [Aerolutibacter ruishenii]|uniref:Hpt domain-containing protein n=1 Tax=Aerolutibacter ruishenii TaxID=686800 RepID=A0A562LGQ6_9GAMM|nr:response regulator [Lysobacter ruishenii]TWI06793.1 Hpt domain-containing protein [Lysobacter ruishenii]